MRILYCENGCGSRIGAADVLPDDMEAKEITVTMECYLCEEETEFIEGLTVVTTFKCTGCDQTKEASIKPTRGQAKTQHHCGECGRETVWHETGWEHIEVT